MKKTFLASLLCFVFVSANSCGRKGPVLPPLRRIPQTVSGLTVVQIGRELHLRWSNPAAFVDGTPLPEESEVEIWLYTQETSSLETTALPPQDEFGKHAAFLTTLGREVGKDPQTGEEKQTLPREYDYSLEGLDFLKKTYAFAMRIKAAKRYSAFSNAASIHPLNVSMPPSGLHAEIQMDKILLRWDAPKTSLDETSAPTVFGYNVYREESDGIPRRMNSEPVKTTTFEDKSFAFDQLYKYHVRALCSESLSKYESGESPLLEVKTEDVFPPAPPKGVTIVAGSTLISLSWESGSETDLAGYHVWRREEGGEFKRIDSGLVLENSFSDAGVKKSIRYYYAITAVDEKGNESERSKVVSEIVREAVP